MKRTKIAFLLNGIFYGGATRSLYLLLKGLSLENKYEFYVYSNMCKAEGIKNDFLKYVKEVQIVQLNSLYINQTHVDGKNRYNKVVKETHPELIQSLIQNKIDILHINTSVFSHLLGEVKEKVGCKIICHVRELIPPSESHFLAKYMIFQIESNSDQIICISDNESERFKRYPEKVNIIPNPFDFSRVLSRKKSDFRNAYNLTDDTVIISMFSYFGPKKGHKYFLQILAELKKQALNSDYKFVIVGVKTKTRLYRMIAKKILGMKDYRSEIMKYIKRNKLNDKIILLPYQKDVFPVLFSTDVVVRPAKTQDPWGRDIIEAMAMSKPVVATGQSEFYIEHKKTGYLIPYDNVTHAANVLKLLIEDSSLRRDLGSAGFQRVQNMCDLNKNVASLSTIYQKVLNE